MTSYHINPNTGNPNVCPDEAQCKFASEEGVNPPHFETQVEAKKAVAAQIFSAFSATQTVSNDSESNTSKPEEPNEELRGSENLEKAITFARKLDNSIALKRPVYQAKLKRLRAKAFRVIKLAPGYKELKKGRLNG